MSEEKPLVLDWPESFDDGFMRVDSGPFRISVKKDIDGYFRYYVDGADLVLNNKFNTLLEAQRGAERKLNHQFLRADFPAHPRTHPDDDQIIIEMKNHPQYPSDPDAQRLYATTLEIHNRETALLSLAAKLKETYGTDLPRITYNYIAEETCGGTIYKKASEMS